MSTSKSTSITAEAAGWPKALEDAKVQLEWTLRREQQLRLAIQVMEEKIKSGEAYPGLQPTNV